MWKQTGGKRKRREKEESEPRRGSPGLGGLRQTVRAEPGDRSSLHLLKQYNNSFLSHPLSKGFYCDGPSLPPPSSPSPHRNCFTRPRPKLLSTSAHGCAPLFPIVFSLVSSSRDGRTSYGLLTLSSTLWKVLFFILIAPLPPPSRNERKLSWDICFFLFFLFQFFSRFFFFFLG